MLGSYEYALARKMIACIFINYFGELGLIIVLKEVLRHWLNDLLPHAHKTYEIYMLNISLSHG